MLTGAVVTDQVRYTGEWDRCLMPVIDAVITDQVRYTGEWDGCLMPVIFALFDWCCRHRSGEIHRWMGQGW